MASNSGSVSLPSIRAMSYPSDRRHDLNSWCSSLPLLSLSKCLCGCGCVDVCVRVNASVSVSECAVSEYNVQIGNRADRENILEASSEFFQLFLWDSNCVSVYIEQNKIIVNLCVTMLTLYTLLLNNVRSTIWVGLYVTHLACICCSRLCCILMTICLSWSHCWARLTGLCSVYLCRCVYSKTALDA